jgi:single-strand DNA-binding protein
MAGVNKVTILGRLGKDPEVRNFQNGGKVVHLRVATSERFKDREGNPQERTEWHAVAIFNEKLGEVAQKYLHKGSEVYLEGKLETRKWQDQSGQERHATEIVLRPFGGELALVGSHAPQRMAGEAAPPAEAPSEAPAKAARPRARPAREEARNGWDLDAAAAF